MRIAPGVAEIVFRAGAEGGGELFAVDKEFLVAFAPPAAARVPDVQRHAAEPALAPGLEHDPIGPAVLGQLDRVAMPLGVEMAQAREGPAQRRMGDLEFDLSRSTLSSLTSSTTALLPKGMYQ